MPGGAGGDGDEIAADDHGSGLCEQRPGDGVAGSY
jgi:hypothetical protein